MNDVTSGGRTAGRTRMGWLALGLLAVALFLRVAGLDLMEFKSDEVEALLLTRRWLAEGIPQYGMMSGVGVRNPPGFVFMMIPPVVASMSPLVACAYIVGLNLLALYLLYRLCVAVTGQRAAMWSLGLLAAHPWLILYSRKLWAQSLLPLFVVLILLVVSRCMRVSLSRAVAWLPVLVVMAWQVHFSAYAAAVFAAVWVATQAVRRRLHWGALLGGCAAALVLLAPYLCYLGQSGFRDLGASMRVGSGPSLAGAMSTLMTWLDTVFAGGLGYLFAFQPMPLSGAIPGMGGKALDVVALGCTVLVAAFAGVGLMKRSNDTGRDVLHAGWLALFALIPPVLYGGRGISSPPHYFIIGLPPLLVLAGRGMALLESRCAAAAPGRWQRILRHAGLVLWVVPAAGVAVWLSIMGVLRRDGGTAGDYGPSYRAQREAAAVLCERGIPPERVDARTVRDGGAGIFYLMVHVLPVGGTDAGLSARVGDAFRVPAGCPEGASEVPLRTSALRLCVR